MAFYRVRSIKASRALALLLALLAIVAVPFSAMADGNRVYYGVNPLSFSVFGTPLVQGTDFDINYQGKMVDQVTGTGITKVTVYCNNNSDLNYPLNFTIDNINGGATGDTLFEARKGPTNNDLSGNVTLSADNGQSGNPILVNFASTTSPTPLYVHVDIPACNGTKDGSTFGTFRVQAHPSTDSANQGNGPGVVVYVVAKTDYTPPSGGTM